MHSSVHKQYNTIYNIIYNMTMKDAASLAKEAKKNSYVS